MAEGVGLKTGSDSFKWELKFRQATISWRGTVIQIVHLMYRTRGGLTYEVDEQILHFTGVGY